MKKAIHTPITESPFHIEDVDGLKKLLDPVKVQDWAWPNLHAEAVYLILLSDTMLYAVPYGKELANAHEKAKQLLDEASAKYRKGYASPEAVPLLQASIDTLKPVVTACFERWRQGDATQHKIHWPYKKGIPGFTPDGYLPPGTYRTTWRQFVDHYGYNEKRRFLLGKLDEALTELEKAYRGPVHLAGSFVTSKELPNDTDVCWFEECIVAPDKLDPIFRDKPALMERWLLDNPVHKLLHGMWRVISLKPWVNPEVFGECPTMFCIGMLEMYLPRRKK